LGSRVKSSGRFSWKRMRPKHNLRRSESSIVRSRVWSRLLPLPLATPPGSLGCTAFGYALLAPLPLLAFRAGATQPPIRETTPRHMFSIKHHMQEAEFTRRSQSHTRHYKESQGHLLGSPLETILSFPSGKSTPCSRPCFCFCIWCAHNR
jgi:hypothetical protein